MICYKAPLQHVEAANLTTVGSATAHVELSGGQRAAGTAERQSYASATKQVWPQGRTSANGKGVVNEIQPRLQLFNLPSKILARSFARPLELIAQFALEHADSRELAHNPTVLSRNIRFHLPDLQVTS